MAGPGSQVKTQYCWTVLPHEFKSSPTLLGNTLSQDLKDVNLEGGTLLQYVDALLITRTSFQQSLTNTIATLSHLASCDDKVPAEKAQIFQKTVKFFGFLLEPEKRSLTVNRKEPIIQMRVPNTRKQLRELLGMAGYCCIWIPLWADC